jgi:hypothetical protein
MKMSTTTYDVSLTMQDAVKQYFEVNHFGSDGGYNDKFVELKVGPMVMFLPNVPSRVRAVRVHDLHHVLTGYQTNWIGEFEISAWELATNCSNYGAALVLNLSALISGLLPGAKASDSGVCAGPTKREPVPRPVRGAAEQACR